MASFTERVLVKIDVMADNAVSALGTFKTKVAEAEGFTGKFKAGLSGLGDVFKQAAGSPVAMGAALGTATKIAMDAVHAFEDTAKAALDLSTSTGLSTEEASRWIAVGDDFEVSAEALATGLGKVAKTLDDEKWKKYGIATRDASGEARKTNDILLDSFDMLSRVTNETERARIGQELFGKGYQSLTPLLGSTRAEYEKMLKSVDRGQVITDAEAKKAEKMRIAEDALADALKSVQLSVGALVAEIGPYLEKVAVGITTISDWADEMGVLDAAAKSLLATMGGPASTAVVLYDTAMSATVDTFKLADLSLTELKKKIEDLPIDEQRKITAEWQKVHKSAYDEIDRGRDTVNRAGEAVQGMSKDVRDDTDALYDAKRATQEWNDAYDALIGSLDQEEAWNNLMTKLWAFKDGAGDTAQEGRDLTRAYADFITKANDIPAEKKTELLAQLNQGDLAVVQAYLETWRKGVTVPVKFKGQGDVGFMKMASGGPVQAGVPVIVGDGGREELFVPNTDGTILPKVPSNLGNGGTYVDNRKFYVNVPNQTPEQTALSLQKYYKRNGLS